jgi:hypothetical protein
MAATFRDVPACVDPDACLSAPRRVVDQMALAAPQVRRPIRLVLPIALDMAVPAPQALDASVDPDVVRPVFDLQVLKEAVRGSRRLASADALEALAAHPPRVHPKLLPVALLMVAGVFRSQPLVHPAQSLIQFPKRHAGQDFRPLAAGLEPPPEPKSEPQVAHLAPTDGSE